LAGSPLPRSPITVQGDIANARGANLFPVQ